MLPKDGDGIRINVDSDQTAPLVALLCLSADRHNNATRGAV